ncbi:MAG: ABC transporter ATP-binding protein [Acidobacteria bacterium]|nr:ABC transporter ATP-binding protein [Acidobacteriota bacterium]
MSAAHIGLDGVSLDYPSGPLVQRSLKSLLFKPFGISEAKAPVRTVRALDQVSFEIRHGERIGIVGRNGSGKSSFLRLVAGIYPPSEGIVSVYGRIQGMFDISLGFEGEATGRENIIYRGLVMGLSALEIQSRSADIIAFADIGDFIDYPVRVYSSGMAVRLAFAISTYLQGDILLIDEILGAGDASFQAKAAARMANLLDSASIVVLVSHDMATIRRVCSRCIWLDNGRVLADGDPDRVTEQYISAQT